MPTRPDLPSSPPRPILARRRRAAWLAACAPVTLAAPCAPAGAQDAGVPVAGAPVAVAQTAAPRFTLADALAAARHNPLLRAAGARARSAVGTARQDAAFLNPVVEYRRENLGAPVAPDVFGTVTLGADAYGRRYALRGLVGSIGARAAADSTTAGRVVVFDVARAYWRAALAVGLLDAAAAQQRAVDSLAAVQTRRAQEGAVAEGAAMRTRLEADRARLTTASARAEAERGRADLARALAMPVDSVPWPTDELDVAADSSAAADQAALVALALRQRPEVLGARARLDETQRRQRAERLGALPGIGATAGYKRTAGYNSGVAGVFVSLPLFDRNQGARARAEGDLIAAENDLRAQEAQVSADVVGAIRAYRALVREGPSAARAARTLDTRGRDVVAVTALAYQEGAATLLELLDAVRSRGDLRTAALRWASDLRIARIELDRAAGRAGPDATPPPTPAAPVGASTSSLR